MKELQKELKEGNLAKVYLLYGDENYLKRQFGKKIRAACIPPEDTMNYQEYDGKGVPVETIIDLAQTMPFFSARRMICLKNTGFFKGACDQLAEYMSDIPDTTCILFIEEEVDKRTKLYKAVKKYGRIVECTRQKENDLILWIGSILKKEGKQIRKQDVLFFLEKTGDDMERICQELEKLICYTYGRTVITREDIEEVSSKLITNQIFEMINAMGEKNTKKVLDLYYDLLALKEAPMKILALINRQFQIMLQVKDMENLGKNNSEIASKVGLAPFIVGKYKKQVQHFTVEELKRALSEGVKAEEDIKMGNMTDKLSVELLIVKYSQ